MDERCRRRVKQLQWSHALVPANGIEEQCESNALGDIPPKLRYPNACAMSFPLKGERSIVESLDPIPKTKRPQRHENSCAFSSKTQSTRTSVLVVFSTVPLGRHQDHRSLHCQILFRCHFQCTSPFAAASSSAGRSSQECH